MWLILLNYALWSSVFAVGKSAVLASTPVFLTAVRMLIAGVLLVGFQWFKDRSQLKISLKALFGLSLFGFLGVYLTNILEFWSLEKISAAKVCFLYSLSPFLSAFLSYVHFGEKMTRKKWLGMGLGICAMLPVLMQQSGGLQAIGFLSWPDLAMFGAVIASVYGWILLRISLKNTNVTTPVANAVGMLIGGALAYVHAFAFEGVWPVTNNASFAWGVGSMILISNIICYNIYGLLLKRYTMTLLSFAGLLSPVFASLSAWALLGEPISPIILMCSGVILFALWLIHSEELRLGYVAKTKVVHS
jgi:drug/metabolite transporter (DMT)-like permease